MNKKQEDLLDGFLRDDLSEAEKKDFNELYETNSNFRAEVESAQLIVKGIGRKKIKKELAKFSKGKSSNSWKITLGILVVGLCLFLLWQYFGNMPAIGEHKKPINEEYSTEEKPASTDFSVRNEKDSLNNGEPEKSNAAQSTSEKIKTLDAIRPSDTQKRLPQIEPKLVQRFSFLASEEIEIIGKEGTELYFGANSFQTQSDSVLIELKEYYQVKDMLFSNLSTQTIDGSILQSGGMIKVEAFDRTGRKLQLKEGKSVGINFSSSEQQNSEMKIYYGNDTEETIEWEQKAISKKDSLRKEISVRSRIHGGKYYKDVDKQPIYSTTKKLETTLNENIRYQKQWRNKNDIEAKILYSVGEFGFVQGAYIIGESPTWADSLVRKLFMSLPRFEEAGVHKGEKRAVRMVFTLALNPQQEKQYYSSNEWNEFYDLKIKRRNAEQKQAGVKERRRFLDQSRASFQEGSGAMEKYRRNSERLGWINLDSPCYRETEIIALKLPDSLLDYKVRLVEPIRKVILAPTTNKGERVFKKLPQGIEMFLFVQKGSGENRKFAWQKWEIAPLFPTLTFSSQPDFTGTLE